DEALDLPPVFKRNCPLWTYVLAEAIRHQEDVRIPVKENVHIKTPRLGPVGGRIVAEVILGLLFGDRTSFFTLDPNWVPAGGPNYTVRDFVNYALGKGGHGWVESRADARVYTISRCDRSAECSRPHRGG